MPLMSRPFAVLGSPETEEKLASEEIRRRLIEKAELLAELEARNPKASFGERADALEGEPLPKPVREEDAKPSDFNQGAPLRPAIETEDWWKPVLTGRITADGRKLAGLMSRAKKLEAAAHALGERANAARQAAHTARLELNNYMTSNGLA